MNVAWASLLGLAIIASLLGLVIFAAVVWAVRSSGVRLAILLASLALAFGLIVLKTHSHPDRQGHRLFRVRPPSDDHSVAPEASISSVPAAPQNMDTSDFGFEALVQGPRDVLAEPPQAKQTAEESEPSPLEAEENGPDPGLSLTTGSKVEIDFEARPPWVDRPDADVGEVHYASVASGPFLRQRDARQELDNQLTTVVDEYVNELVGHPHASRWVGYTGQDIRRRFLATEGLFDEIVRSPSFGVMHQSHALLEFGPAFHAEVEQAWHHVITRARLVKVALAGGVLLGMLALLCGYFRADTATRGSFAGRLKLVTATAILAVIAGGCLIARSMPWLWL